MIISADPEITYADVVTLTSWMADHIYTADEVAYAVEKPWKHINLLEQAKADAGE